MNDARSDKNLMQYFKSLSSLEIIMNNNDNNVVSALYIMPANNNNSLIIIIHNKWQKYQFWILSINKSMYKWKSTPCVVVITRRSDDTSGSSG